MEPNIAPENVNPEVKIESANLEGTTMVEASAPQEANLQVEQPSADPVPVQAIPLQQTAPLDQSAVTQPTNPTQDLVEEESRQDETQDKTWVRKAKDVIKEFDEDPYKEEEASEKLQEQYLQDRFNIKVDDKEQV